MDLMPRLIVQSPRTNSNLQRSCSDMDLQEVVQRLDGVLWLSLLYFRTGLLVKVEIGTAGLSLWSSNSSI
jgi:hypothetical protein